MDLSLDKFGRGAGSLRWARLAARLALAALLLTAAAAKLATAPPAPTLLSPPVLSAFAALEALLGIAILLRPARAALVTACLLFAGGIVASIVSSTSCGCFGGFSQHLPRSVHALVASLGGLAAVFLLIDSDSRSPGRPPRLEGPTAAPLPNRG